MTTSTQQLQKCLPDQYQEVSFTSSDKTILSLCEPQDNPMVKDLSMTGLKAVAAKLYRRANAKYGNSAKSEQETEDNIRFIIEDLIKYKSLRLNEVSYIIDEGLAGSYDKEDVRHFSSSRFCKWIKAYVEEQKAATMKKKAQFDHQNLTPPTPEEREIKARLQVFFVGLAEKVEKGELPKNFAGFSEIFKESEKMGVFEPIDLEEKQIIAKACAEYTSYTGDALKAFSRKVSYLYLLHQYAMVRYNIQSLIKHVVGHDKTISGYIMDLAHQRLAEYEQYKADRHETINTIGENDKNEYKAAVC